MSKTESTLIRIHESTKAAMLAAKVYPRETFDDIIIRLLSGKKK